MAKESFSGLFDRVFGSLFGGGGESAANRKELRQISKVLKKSRFKFYDPRLNELSLQFANFIYQLYRFFGPLQQVLSRYAQSDAMKYCIVERGLPKEVLDLRASFNEEAIRQIAASDDTKLLAQKFQQEFSFFKKLIAKAGIKKINLNYNAFQLFLQLVNFDYYYVLKKFDPKIPDLDFVYKPRFAPLIGVKLIEELKDFVVLLQIYDPLLNWDEILLAINEFRGAEVISLNLWKKVKKSLDEVKKSCVIEMIIAVVSGDPNYSTKYKNEIENIVATYVEKIGKELQEALRKVVSEKKNRNVNEYVRKIFDNKPPVVRLKNYSEKMNKQVVEVATKSFVFLQPANYMLAFFVDYLQKDFRDLINQYVIVGKWISPLNSQHMSDSFNRLLELHGELSEFDKSLGDEYRRGQSIRTYIRSSDSRNAVIMDRIVDEINLDAKNLLVDIAQNMVRLAKVLRSLIEDFGQKAVLSNWKEVENSYKGELQKDTQVTYKKIYEMIQLLQIFLAK